MPTQQCKQAYFNLDKIQKAHFFSWLCEGRKIREGKYIIFNIFNEKYIESDLFANLLNLISESYQEELEKGVSSSEAVRTSYKNACKKIWNKHQHNLYCQGAESEVKTDTLLHHVMYLEKVQTMVSEARKYPGSLQTNWEDFLDVSLIDQTGHILMKIKKIKIL
ncbi:MAG: hypothetical protein QNJ37_02155 [Crocosphaera sp.]|nr:hypothetical protein [Crocosphaera sp.]